MSIRSDVNYLDNTSARWSSDGVDDMDEKLEEEEDDWVEFIWEKRLEEREKLWKVKKWEGQTDENVVILYRQETQATVHCKEEEEGPDRYTFSSFTMSS